MKKNVRKLMALLLSLMMVLSMLTACKSTKETSTENTPAPTEEVKEEVAATEEPTEAPTEAVTPEGELPRNETIYYGGLQWGAVNGWNPLSDDMNNALAITQAAGGSRTPMFETLYMYNMLDGSMAPLLADGDYKWNEDRTEITVKMKSAAKWSDGTAVTADDVAYTFDTSVKIGNAQGSQLSPYIESVTAVDPGTVLVKAKLNDEGKAVNPLIVVNYLSQTYVLQKAWIQAVEARCGNDAAAIKKDVGDDVVYSGPYSKYYADDQKVVLIRNENYWGKDASMWGKLPAPKYMCHTIYADNAATEVAFKAGEVDVDQQFIPNIQNLWLNEGLPISTYLEEAPFGICVNMPTAWFNTDKPGLDNAAIRKAIALAVDYDAINANAMTGQSPSFKDIPRSLMNPTDGEQATFDHDAVKDLQWAGNDIESAKKLLDDAGIVDSDGDGIRELDGKNLSFNACAPFGWTDWQAAMEIVATAGKNIGIDITTEFPEWSVYQTVVTAAKQTDYDIFMMWTDSATPTQPWGRMRMLMSSEYNGIEGNWSGNWGHFSNKRIDEIIKLIPAETDAAKLKEYYTEAVKIYLTEVPSFSLMYRPDQFHAVNESVWTNYPENGDGNNIPPMILVNGYGIAGLYKIELVQ
ncbi:MAG: putative transporter substrate binding protein [Anaerocolumna sp.]|nr:putative transporter substrate binding protein [Anaerocolumna sp.]